MNIGQRLALVRHSKNMTIKEVVAKSGKGTYDRVELNKQDIKFTELLKVCEVLEIEIWDLLAEELIIKYKE